MLVRRLGSGLFTARVQQVVVRATALPMYFFTSNTQ